MFTEQKAWKAKYLYTVQQKADNSCIVFLFSSVFDPTGPGCLILLTGNRELADRASGSSFQNRLTIRLKFSPCFIFSVSAEPDDFYEAYCIVGGGGWGSWRVHYFSSPTNLRVTQIGIIKRDKISQSFLLACSRLLSSSSLICYEKASQSRCRCANCLHGSLPLASSLPFHAVDFRPIVYHRLSLLLILPYEQEALRKEQLTISSYLLRGPVQARLVEPFWERLDFLIPDATASFKFSSDNSHRIFPCTRHTSVLRVKQLGLRGTKSNGLKADSFIMRTGLQFAMYSWSSRKNWHCLILAYTEKWRY